MSMAMVKVGIAQVSVYGTARSWRKAVVNPPIS